MPVYQYECDNPGCTIDNKPFEFEGYFPISKYKEIPTCPKCKNAEYVKKVIRTSFPVSSSWKVG